jgi:hypothetical protein
MNYGSLSGAFRLQNGGIFDNGTERWVVTYQPMEAILTATAFTADGGSTLLLLTLSLLAVVTLAMAGDAHLGDFRAKDRGDAESRRQAVILRRQSWR